MVAGVMLLATWGKTEVQSSAYQRLEASRLERLLASDVKAGRESAARREARATGLVGRLEIPRLGVSTIVAEGIHPRTLERAVGHVSSTPFPGEGGNVGLAGHRDTFLRDLRRVRRGDAIRVRTPDGTFVYEVDSTRVVTPERVDVLDDGKRPMLTLVTCYPFHVIGPAPRRFVVSARQTSFEEPAGEDRAARRRPGG